MKFTLAMATDYLRAKSAPRAFFAFIKQVKSVFTFTHERANRLVRYVKIVRAYEQGQPIGDIEDEYGCSRSTVLRYARAAELPKRPRHFDPSIRARTIALYKEGKSLIEIQATLGVSQAYVSKTATEEGINRRNFKKRK